MKRTLHTSPLRRAPPPLTTQSRAATATARAGGPHCSESRRGKNSAGWRKCPWTPGSSGSAARTRESPGRKLQHTSTSPRSQPGRCLSPQLRRVCCPPR
eukprot:3689384-Rhodomonas_salina.4